MLDINQKSKIKNQNWVNLCPLSALPVAGGHYVIHANRPLAVFRAPSGDVVVTDDTCPHAGGSLSAGTIDHDTGCVVCPWHGWPFRLADGKCPDNPAIGVRRHPSRVVNGQVQIQV